MFLEIVVTIMAVAFLLVALFAIPPLLQIRRTAETIAVTLRTLNEHLPGILKNLENITTNINQTTSMVNHQLDDLSYSFRKLQKIISFLVDLGQIVQANIRIPFFNSLTSLAAIAKGVRVFLSVLTEKSESPGSPQRK